MASFRIVWDDFKIVFRLNSRIYPWNWWRERYVSTVEIGARNPYAMYRSVYHVDPFTPHHEGGMVAPLLHIDPTQAREFLGRLCMEEGCWLPYEKLFDPKYGSCLFCKETIREVRRKKRNILASILFFKSDSEPDNDHGSSQADNLVGGVKGICVIDHWEPSHDDQHTSYDSPNILNKWMDDPKTPKRKPDIHPTYDDPQQGPIVDCYFIAALSSIAWYFGTNTATNFAGEIVSDPDYLTKPINFLQAPLGLLSVLHSVSGAAINPAAGASPIRTDYSLPKAYDNSFAGAKAISGESSWVSYYEKAFARYLETIGKMAPSANPHEPDICRIPCGDPGETLRTLMLKEPALLKAYVIDPSKTTEVNAGLVWNELRDHVIEDERTKANSSLITIVPAVARTHTTAPSGIEYDDELIVAAHAYSLLGIACGANKKTDQYVILRNPYGQNPGFSYGSQYKNGSPKYNLLGNVGYPIPPAPNPQPTDFEIKFINLENSTGAIYSFKPWITETTPAGPVILPNKGRFALHINDFVKYFSEFDYVMPT